jgi:threonine aldolase
MTADTPEAKLTPEAVGRLAARWQGLHHVKVRVLSITEATEAGTVYTAAEVAGLAAEARRHGLLVHWTVRDWRTQWRISVAALAT